MTTFAGPGPRPLSDEIKARTIIAQYLVNEFGPALHGLVTNTHISLPENILTIYQQDNPWGLLAAPELVITDFTTVGSTLQEDNPERTPVWTGLYFDLSAGYWTITYQVPVDIDGQHMTQCQPRCRHDQTHRRPGGTGNPKRLTIRRRGYETFTVNVACWRWVTQALLVTYC